MDWVRVSILYWKLRKITTYPCCVGVEFQCFKRKLLTSGFVGDVSYILEFSKIINSDLESQLKGSVRIEYQIFDVKEVNCKLFQHKKRFSKWRFLGSEHILSRELAPLRDALQGRVSLNSLFVDVSDVILIDARVLIDSRRETDNRPGISTLGICRSVFVCCFVHLLSFCGSINETSKLLFHYLSVKCSWVIFDLMLPWCCPITTNRSRFIIK